MMKIDHSANSCVMANVSTSKCASVEHWNCYIHCLEQPIMNSLIECCSPDSIMIVCDWNRSTVNTLLETFLPIAFSTFPLQFSWCSLLCWFKVLRKCVQEDPKKPFQFLRWSTMGIRWLRHFSLDINLSSCMHFDTWIGYATNTDSTAMTHKSQCTREWQHWTNKPWW